MDAIDRTTSFIEALESIAGIDRLDFGIRRQDGTFIQRDLQSLDSAGIKKSLPFLRAENIRKSDVYFRPAQQESWTLIFLDDLTNPQALGISRKCQAWIIETSPGLYHVWVLTDRILTRTELYAEQSRIVSLGFGDHGSVSGEHFGRLPGFKNWKRGGPWVNLKSSPNPSKTCLHPLGGRVLHLESPDPPGTCPARYVGGVRGGGMDSSESGREFGWCCGWLRSGRSAEEAIRRLTSRASERGKNSPGEYARLTVRSAIRAIGPL